MEYRIAKIGIENNQTCYVYECDRKMTKLRVTQCYYATVDQLAVNPKLLLPFLNNSTKITDYIFYTPVTDKPTLDLLHSSHGIFNKVSCDMLITRTKDDNLAKVLFMNSYRDAAAKYLSDMQKVITLPVEEVIQ